MTQQPSQDLLARLSTLESRTQRLASRNRWLGAFLMLSVALSLFLGIASMPTADAQQARYLMGAIGQSLQEIEQAELNRLSTDEAREEAQFAELMKRARREMIRTERIDTGLASAVALSEIKEDLAYVPQMAADLRQINAKLSAVPMMATQMEDITWRLNVITANMDNTMGRAGRMMNWFWPLAGGY